MWPPVLFAIVLTTALCTPMGARAQEIGDWGGLIRNAVTAQWTGQRVRGPDFRPRPESHGTLRSTYRPLVIHDAQGFIPAARMEETLAALEAAHDLLSEAGWEAPPGDGGLGGDSAFDLYITSGPRGAAEAHADHRILWSFLDASSAHGVVDMALSSDSLLPCVTQAYAEAVLLGLDPAEAATWRRATATWMSFMVTGTYGCGDAVAEQQREPWHSWIAGGAEEGAGGALLLTMISGRHDGGTGAFVHDLWTVARQRTWEGEQLRGSPDLWESLETLLEPTRDSPHELIRQLAVARWFTGDPERKRHAPLSLFRDLPLEAQVPLMDRVTWAELPEHVNPGEEAIEPFGSAYVWVDLGDAPPQSSLRIWLRGEFGVEWALDAVRLSADGRELGRVSAPARREPRSYLRIELVHNTAHVLVVVTNLGRVTPDADKPIRSLRNFKLILDRG